MPEYWIVNVEKQLVEVHTAPTEGRYANRVAAGVGDVIRLVEVPDVEIAVRDVFG